LPNLSEGGRKNIFSESSKDEMKVLEHNGLIENDKKFKGLMKWGKAQKVKMGGPKCNFRKLQSCHDRPAGLLAIDQHFRPRGS